MGHDLLVYHALLGPSCSIGIVLLVPGLAAGIRGMSWSNRVVNEIGASWTVQNDLGNDGDTEIFGNGMIEKLRLRLEEILISRVDHVWWGLCPSLPRWFFC